jgi:hypothetical protein
VATYRKSRRVGSAEMAVTGLRPSLAGQPIRAENREKHAQGAVAVEPAA